MNDSTKTHKLLTGFARGLRKIRSIVDELGDLGQTTRQVLMNIGSISNVIEKTATELSFISTAAELARFTELSTKVKNDIEEALKKRMAFMDELKPKSNKDTTAFITFMNEYKPNGLTPEEARRAESPAATAYALYSLSLMILQSDGERLAEWLEGKAVKRAADNSQAALLEKTAADVAELKGTMIEIWKRYNARTRTTTPAEQKLCAAMNKALFAYWKAFQNGELDGTLTVQEHDKYIVGRTHRRSAAEFLKTHGKDVVWTAHDGKQYTLQELCPTVEDVQRMIDRNNKAIRRAERKNGQSADKKKI